VPATGHLHLRYAAGIDRVRAQARRRGRRNEAFLRRVQRDPRLEVHHNGNPSHNELSNLEEFPSNEA
jgi:hypothetical protein